MINHTVLQGRLTKDPEMRQTNSGVSVCSFTVAWSEKHKETETQLFMNCTAWRSTAEFIDKYFAKGREIAVEGKLVTRKWTDKEGNNRSTTELNVENVHFCGKKAENDDNASTGNNTAENSFTANSFADISDETEENLPF